MLGVVNHDGPQIRQRLDKQLHSTTHRHINHINIYKRPFFVWNSRKPKEERRQETKSLWREPQKAMKFRSFVQGALGGKVKE